MIRVAWVRGKYLNPFEGQNYRMPYSDIAVTGISSLRPIDSNVPFPLLKLPSIADIPVLPRAIRFLSNRIIGDSQILFGLERLAGKFDIFHTADPHYYYSYQLAKLRFANRINKLIVTSWETIPFNNESVEKKREIKRFVYKNTDLFICHTIRARKVLEAEGVDRRLIELIPLGVDLNRFKPLWKQKNSVTVLFVGRLVEEKGILDLYRVFTALKIKSGLRFKLRIVGDGPLRTRLMSDIEKDGMTGRVTVETFKYTGMDSVYQDSDIFVLPSGTTKTWEEQYGMVLIEAMACGLPILGYRTGAIGEVAVNCGLFVRESDTGGLRTGLTRLILSGSLRRKLGTMGRERALARFNSDKTAEKLYFMYKRLAGK